MKRRLLNFSKNLIICIGLVVIVMMLFFTTSSYAADEKTVGQLIRETVGTWYKVVVKFSIAVYSIGYLIIVLKLFADKTPER